MQAYSVSHRRFLVLFVTRLPHFVLGTIAVAVLAAPKSPPSVFCRHQVSQRLRSVPQLAGGRLRLPWLRAISPISSAAPPKRIRSLLYALPVFEAFFVGNSLAPLAAPHRTPKTLGRKQGLRTLLKLKRQIENAYRQWWLSLDSPLICNWLGFLV